MKLDTYNPSLTSSQLKRLENPKGVEGWKRVLERVFSIL